MKIINSYLHKLLTTAIILQKLDGLECTSVQKEHFQNMLFSIIGNFCMCCAFVANRNALLRKESKCLDIGYV